MTAVYITKNANDGANVRRQECGVRFVQSFNESMERQQEKQRRKNKADPLLVRKFAVILCIALMAYCYYVFVGRACVPMIRQDKGNHGSRYAGIALLVVFNILWSLMVYAYINIILTPPGFAKDYVHKGPSPEPPFGYNRYRSALDISPQTLTGPPFEVIGYPTAASGTSETVLDTSVNAVASQCVERKSAGHPVTISSLVRDEPSRLSSSNNAIAPKAVPPIAKLSNQQTQAEPGREVGKSVEDAVVEQEPTSDAAGVLPAIKPRSLDILHVRGDKMQGSAAQVPTQSVPVSTSTSRPAYLNFPDPPAPSIQRQSTTVSNQMQILMRKLQREVPLNMPLHPYFRYCNRCEFVRPPRAHHCRHCNTCILNLDHHCPWIGQCCGAQNHVHFVAFCFWAFVCLVFVGIALSILIAAPGVLPSPSLDGQMVAICATAYFFSIFTASMTVTHIQLILMNQSTIEQIAISDMRHREQAALQRELGIFAIKQKRRIVKQWDQEWGRPHTEGNLWWLESKSRNWKATMGPSPLWWLFPTPWYRPNEGLHYETNPRRGEGGQWRRREEWPKELQ